MSLKGLIERTVGINNRFKRQLSRQGRMLDLVEEVGELANAILMVDGEKDSGDPAKKRTKEDIADAIADIMYDLILLANEYDVDLTKEYGQMLTKMEERFKEGDLIGKNK